MKIRVISTGMARSKTAREAVRGATSKGRGREGRGEEGKERGKGKDPPYHEILDPPLWHSVPSTWRQTWTWVRYIHGLDWVG